MSLLTWQTQWIEKRIFREANYRDIRKLALRDAWYEKDNAWWVKEIVLDFEILKEATTIWVDSTSICTKQLIFAQM